jgi:hypothetical protein
MESLDRARRLGAILAGEWTVAGLEVRNDRDEVVAKTYHRETAEYLALLHGLFLPLVQSLQFARRKLADRAAPLPGPGVSRAKAGGQR